MALSATFFGGVQTVDVSFSEGIAILLDARQPRQATNSAGEDAIHRTNPHILPRDRPLGREPPVARHARGPAAVELRRGPRRTKGRGVTSSGSAASDSGAKHGHSGVAPRGAGANPGRPDLEAEARG